MDLTKQLLESRNRAALREILELEAILTRQATVPFLSPYRSKLLAFAKQCQRDAEKNLEFLALGVDDVYDDVRSWTTLLLENVRVITHVLAGPLLRAAECDQLSVAIIKWLHDTDSRSAQLPAVCHDGDPAVLPLIEFTPIYQFPTLMQKSVLHLPLYVHEFGHVLYAIYKPELDELVKELQEFILSELQPMSQRNDLRAKRQRELQLTVAVTWYAWTQELFCDAVGLVMAGPAYGFAFSDYMLRLDRGDYSLDRMALAYSSHPITWLRIKFLVSRARRLGFNEAASQMEAHWSSVAESLGVIEDFDGYFEEAWTEKIECVLDDMLTETSPRSYAERADVASASQREPMALLNEAWRAARTSSDSFTAWEASAVSNFLRHVSHVSLR